jgi:hypothetical protein
MLERLHLIDGVTEVTLQSSSTGSAGSGGSASGTCPPKDVSFTATINFDPLPSTSAVAAATPTRTVSDSTAAGSKATTASSAKASSK